MDILIIRVQLDGIISINQFYNSYICEYIYQQNRVLTNVRGEVLANHLAPPICCLLTNICYSYLPLLCLCIYFLRFVFFRNPSGSLATLPWNSLQVQITPIIPRSLSHLYKMVMVVIEKSQENHGSFGYVAPSQKLNS